MVRSLSDKASAHGFGQLLSGSADAVHKGAKAADTKARLLPVVTPRLGVAQQN